MARAAFLSKEMKLSLYAWRKVLLAWVLLGGGLWLALTCLSYDVYDPSFNTAIDGSVHNICGVLGAYVADIVMQLFGISGHLLWVIPMGWGVMMLGGRFLSWLSFRILSLMLGVSCLTLTLSFVKPSLSGILGMITHKIVGKIWPSQGLLWISLCLAFLFLVVASHVKIRDLSFLFKMMRRINVPVLP